MDRAGQVSSEKLKKMASLGYLAGASDAGGPLPNPRASLPILEGMKIAFTLGAKAFAGLRSVHARQPRFFDAQYAEAEVLARLGRRCPLLGRAGAVHFGASDDHSLNGGDFDPRTRAIERLGNVSAGFHIPDKRLTRRPRVTSDNATQGEWREHTPATRADADTE